MSRVALRVGERFDPKISRFSDASVYAWDPYHAPSHHRLVVFAERPTASEIAAFRSGGRVELALCVEGPAIVLLWCARGWPWSDAPYSWHLQGTDGVPSTEPMPAGSGAPLDMILVDGATGRVAAMRTVAMPAAFVEPLHAAIAAQASAPRDDRAYDATLARITQVSCDELAAHATARCVLGESARRPS